ncbi:MAG TPA: VWA domain-containing protein [Chloroflexota bacterium]|nr:VWA domain-containing protein [Chloroflexota bacterium]
MPVSTSRLQDFSRGLRFVDLRDRETVRFVARSTLASSRGERTMVDIAFDALWLTLEGAPTAGGSAAWEEKSEQHLDLPESMKSEGGSRPPESASRVGLDPGPERCDESAGRPVGLYSAEERLRYRDFSQLSERELEDAKRFVASIRWYLPERRSRRRRRAKRTGEIDMRRLLRHSLRHGGEIVDLPHRRRRSKRRRLVLMCDISGSMDCYTRVLLHFLHSVEARFSAAEVFVFGTRLTRITPLLRWRDADAALAAVSEEVQDWAGGTRIGDSIGAFHRLWARRSGANGAIIVIISDGWDRGDPERLKHEMQRLRRTGHRLLWLNPLLGSRDYRPLTRGMAAALPLVDDFLPVNNINSLQELAGLFGALSARSRSASSSVEPRRLHRRDRVTATMRR